MKLFKFSFFCLSATFISLNCSAGELTGFGDFALLDHQGKSHQLSWYGDQKAIVIFIQGNASPIVRNSVPPLKEIRGEFESRGVAFFMLNPLTQDNRQSIAEEAEEFGYDIPILVDEAQLVAESLGVQRLAETLVINPKTMTLVFRGPVDDQLGDRAGTAVAKNQYLKDALNAFLSGQALTNGSEFMASPATGIRIRK